MSREVVYLGHSNSIDCVLKANNTAVDLSGVTQMTVNFGTYIVASTNNATNHILWNQAGYETGEVRMYFGATTVPSGDYDAPLIVYDATATAGIVWGKLGIRVRAGVAS